MQERGWLTQRFEKALQNGWEIPDYQGLLDKIELDLDCQAICPTTDNVFKAFELLRPEDVKYVILGQDPYWQTAENDGLPIATGLAFGVRQRDGLHHATAINKIMPKIYQYRPDHEWDWTLESWAKNYKILLLNTALTVPMPKQGESGREKSANKHLPHWKEFTQAALSFLRDSQSQLNTNDRFKCFAWGKKAMTAFEEARLTPIFAYHPCASVTGPGSFNDFWEQDYGKRLIVPKS